MTNTWARETYRQNAAYVPALGAAVFELLNPQAGERILDLGCGEGTLTEKIAATGAGVVGIDASEEMIAGAKARGLDARLMDAEQLRFEHEFDGVMVAHPVQHGVGEDAVELVLEAQLLGVHQARVEPAGFRAGDHLL